MVLCTLQMDRAVNVCLVTCVAWPSPCTIIHKQKQTVRLLYHNLHLTNLLNLTKAICNFRNITGAKKNHHKCPKLVLHLSFLIGK